MKKLLLLAFIISTFLGASQNQFRMMYDTTKNFYDIQKAADKYWKKQMKEEAKEKDKKEKEHEDGSGYEQYKRWERYMAPRVYPSGNMANVGPKRAYLEFQNYLQSNPNAKPIGTAAITATTANWTAIGPFGSAAGTGAGRLQCIRFHPAGTNTVYVGSAAGGLWVSTNSGASWTTTTDQIASLGVSDVVVDPSNYNNIYISTGDQDGAATGFSQGDSKSVGVLKSTDGGATWNTTGLSWTTSQQRFISKLLINPLNTVELFAFTSVGIYRTRDAGANWTLAAAGVYKDAEYKPGDTTTIYAANGATLSKSINGGQTFSNTTFSGVGLGQIRIAVTAADPNYVYIVGDLTSGAFGRLVRSTNSATTFSTMSTTPNVLGGTQGWYDLTLAASPSNKDEIMVGGVDQWKSTNGGTSWTQVTAAYTAGPPYIHPDQHDCIYANATTIYAANDGGLNRTTNGGTSWSTLNGNMNISEPYFLGVSASNPNLIIAGLQDNGTILWNGATWTLVKGGDGMECFIDWNNNNIMIGSYTNGAFAKSTNGGASFSNIVTGLTGTGNWIAPITQDPTNPSIFYAGYQNVFKSTNQGGSWSQIGALGGSGDVMVINAAPSNSNTIYAARAGSLFKTTNGGTTWSNITGTIPAGGAAISDIDIDNTNANNVYVTLSGYIAGTKVFYSNDGGLSWTNYSSGLPNIPANCIVFKKNSPGAIYVGTDVGVYYRELSMSSFIPYYTGLPNVWVNDLEIYYPTGKLRAATFGRGMWQTDLYSQPGVVPTAYFSTFSNTICVGSTLGFTDASSNSPTSWAWTFTGGSPSSSTIKNPSITYTAAGVYVVSIVATNSVGASTPYTTAVTVINTPTSVPTNTGTCAGQAANLFVTTNASNVVWQGGQTGLSAAFAPTVTTVYSYTVFSGGCSNSGTATMTVGALPPTPTITTAGNILTSSSAASYQWYLNGSIIPGATAQTYNTGLTGDGFYSVWTGNGTGCENSSTAIYITVTSVTELSVFQALEVSPNPAKDYIYISFNSSYDKELSFTLTNTLGQTVKNGTIKPVQGQKTIISLDGISEGSYILHLNSSGSDAKYKFIKQ